MILKKAIFLEIKKLPVTHNDAEKMKADRKNGISPNGTWPKN